MAERKVTRKRQVKLTLAKEFQRLEEDKERIEFEKEKGEEIIPGQKEEGVHFAKG